MIKIDFSEEEIEALKHERFYHPHPRVQRKMEALLLKSQKVPHEQICQIADISANTLRSYLQAYNEAGILFCKVNGHRGAISANIFTRFKPHRAFMEIC